MSEVVHELLAEWRAGEPERGENVTIPAYLEAMAGWLEASEQAWVSRGHPVPSDGWTVFAAAMQAAAIYE